MAVQKGTMGGVFGIKATSITAPAVNGATHEVIRTYNYSKEADSKEIRGLTGDVVSMTYYNARERLQVDIIVTGATLAAALADFILLPAVGDDCTVIATGDTQIAASSTQWIVEAASKVATQDDHGTMSLTLVRYTNDLNTVS